LRTPADGAGTSIVALSVSSSTKGSSTATVSPAFLNHLPMVASVTDSPRVGTRISVMISSPLRDGRIHFAIDASMRFGFSRDVNARAKARAQESGSAQRLLEESLELGQMLRHQPGRGGGGRRTAGVARPRVRRVDLVQHPFEIRLDEVPRAHVARLFLAPD